RLGHLARNCTVRPRRRDAAYLQTQLLIAQKKEAGIQLQAEEFDLMAAAADLDEIEEVNANCILMANLQQASTSGTQTDKAPVYDSDGSAEKLENENVELEFQVQNYEKEIAHLKTTYKNLFDSISVTRAQTKTIIDSLQNKLHDTIYENAKLRAQLFDKVSEQVDTTKGTSTNTKFANQSTERKPSLHPVRKNLVVRQPNAFQSEHTTSSKNRVPQKVDETNDLSKPVTSNSAPSTRESKGVQTVKVIASRIFRTNHSKTSRVDNVVPNKPVKSSVRTKSITASQPNVIHRQQANSNSSGFSPTRVNNAAKTISPQPARVHSKSKSSWVPSASKSSCNKNKDPDIRYDKSEVICAMCKQCLFTANHDVCMLNYVKDMNSRGKKQKANVSNTENQKKQKPKVIKPKKVGSKERLASPKPSKPRFCLRWSPTGRFFDIKGKIIASSESESQSDCSNVISFSAAILVFGDLQWGNLLITRVYFVEGLGHNLFSVGQFCDSDLEVAFRRNSCFVRSLEGVDLLKGNRSTNLYTINLHEMASASPICLMGSSNFYKSWIGQSTFIPPKDKAKGTSHNPTPNQFHILSIEFKNQILKEYFDSVGISHQASSVRTPQQNGVVERRNRTLVEAARTMLIFSRAPLFLWAEAIATACYTPKSHPSFNRRFNKHHKTASVKARNRISPFFYNVLGALTMAFDQSSSKLRAQSMTSGQITMYDDYIDVSNVILLTRTAPDAQAPQVHADSNGNTNTAEHTTDTNKFIHQATNCPIFLSQDVRRLETNNMFSINPQQTAENVSKCIVTMKILCQSLLLLPPQVIELHPHNMVDPSNMQTIINHTPKSFNDEGSPTGTMIGEPSSSSL
ncbi:retrovirus-related pol polyprotein from transposon TNT 1-94, partial [Tanacetum coccineum]